MVAQPLELKLSFRQIEGASHTLYRNVYHHVCPLPVSFVELHNLLQCVKFSGVYIQPFVATVIPRKPHGDNFTIILN